MYTCGREADKKKRRENKRNFYTTNKRESKA